MARDAFHENFLGIYANFLNGKDLSGRDFPKDFSGKVDPNPIGKKLNEQTNKITYHRNRRFVKVECLMRPRHFYLFIYLFIDT